MRSLVKAVVPCDVNKNRPTPTKYVDQYDIVKRDVIFKSLEQVGFCDVKRMAKTRGDLKFPDNFEPVAVKGVSWC